MATTAQRRTPTHLWVVGLIALLWNAFGCYDYLMTESANSAYLSNFPPEMVAYSNSLPGWTVAFWALGVWGGLAGALLLLIRSHYAVWAFALSFVGAAVGIGYQLFMTTMPASMTAGVMGMMPYVIVAVAAFLLWYSWREEKKGVLR